MRWRFAVFFVGLAACGPGASELDASMRDGGAGRDGALGSDASEPGSGAPLGLDWQMPEAAADAFTVLVANVGNVDLIRCGDVAFNLCGVETEAAVTARIAALDPDVVLLSELLSPDQCEGLAVEDESHLCHPANAHPATHQARRLLGAGYQIVCDDRAGSECMGVRAGVGRFAGCGEGALCLGGAASTPLPAGCDPGFTVSTVPLELGDARIDLINAHPPGGPSDAAAACRREMLMPAMIPVGEALSIRSEAWALIAGDFNFDPYRDARDRADVVFFASEVSTRRDDPGRAFAFHSGIVEADPPPATSLIRLTLDHAISEGLWGRCITLGRPGGEPALDEGVDLPIHRRLDHLALFCTLSPLGD